MILILFLCDLAVQWCRYQSADEMHAAVYSCLIDRGEAEYSVFISYRVASEAPLARLLFDELNNRYAVALSL